MNQDISDKLLNAYIDGELTDDEMNHISIAIRNNKTLQERIKQLKYVCKMVKIAYHDIESK